ncbi:MAG: hypothetical protein WC455_18975, partial [Dehalococcoidia bacterium]
TVDYALVRSATYVIAASNSSNAEKAGADVVCDGTQDDVEIQAGLDAVGGYTYGGKVLLLAGLYNITNTLSLPNTSYVTLEGMGPSSTTIYLANSSNCAMIAKATPGTTKYRQRIALIGLDGNSANNATGTYGIDATGIEGGIFENIRISDTKGTGFYEASASGGKLYNVRSTGCGGYGYYLYGGAGWLLNNVETYGCVGGIYFREAYECYASNLHLDQDTATHELYIGGSQRIHITNLFAAPMEDYMAGIFFADSQDCSVVGGSVYPPDSAEDSVVGAYFYASNGNTTSGCSVSNVAFDGGQVAYMRGTRETIAGTGTITNSIVSNCQFRDLYEERHSTSNYFGVTYLNNQGYIGRGEIRTYTGSISTLTENAYNSVDNPYGQNVLVLDETIYISTKATSGAPRLDCGIGSSATTDYTTVFDDITCETVGPYHSVNTATIGQQTSPILWQTGTGNRYFNHSIKAAAATGLVATYTIRVMGV